MVKGEGRARVGARAPRRDNRRRRGAWGAQSCRMSGCASLTRRFLVDVVAALGDVSDTMRHRRRTSSRSRLTDRPAANRKLPIDPTTRAGRRRRPVRRPYTGSPGLASVAHARIVGRTHATEPHSREPPCQDVVGLHRLVRRWNPPRRCARCSPAARRCRTKAPAHGRRSIQVGRSAGWRSPWLLLLARVSCAVARVRRLLPASGWRWSMDGQPVWVEQMASTRIA